jgi:hypothetical protein
MIMISASFWRSSGRSSDQGVPAGPVSGQVTSSESRRSEFSSSRSLRPKVVALQDPDSGPYELVSQVVGNDGD